jgi:hypothetical protein
LSGVYFSVYDNSKLILRQQIIPVAGNSSVLVRRPHPGNIHGLGIIKQEQAGVSTVVFMINETENEAGKLNEANMIFYFVRKLA